MPEAEDGDQQRRQEAERGGQARPHLEDAERAEQDDDRDGRPARSRGPCCPSDYRPATRPVGPRVLPPCAVGGPPVRAPTAADLSASAPPAGEGLSRARATCRAGSSMNVCDLSTRDGERRRHGALMSPVTRIISPFLAGLQHRVVGPLCRGPRPRLELDGADQADVPQVDHVPLALERVDRVLPVAGEVRLRARTAPRPGRRRA